MTRRCVLLASFIFLICYRAAGGESIHDAARDGDLAKVKEILQADPGAVHLRDEGRMIALHWAAFKGHVEVADLLRQRMQR